VFSSATHAYDARAVTVDVPDTSDCVAYATRFVIAAYDGVTPRPGKGLPHAQAVADTLRAEGCDIELQVVGLLHDVVEDGARTEDEVRAAFPDAIADRVLALTEDATIGDYRQRKAALRRPGALSRDTAPRQRGGRGAGAARARAAPHGARRGVPVSAAARPGLEALARAHGLQAVSSTQWLLLACAAALAAHLA
jgi:hypothetical protein